MSEHVLDLIDYLQEPDAQRVLLALAQVVGAVVSASWAGMAAWYVLTGLRCLTLLVVGRPVLWAWRRVWPAPSEEQRQQHALLAMLEDALAAGSTFDATQGVLVAPPLYVEVEPYARYGAPDTYGRAVVVASRDDLVKAELHGLPVTERELGQRGWQRFAAAVKQAVAEQRAAQEQATLEAEARTRQKAREALLASLVAGKQVAANVLGSNVTPPNG